MERNVIYFEQEHMEFRRLVKNFINSEILPYVKHWEKKRHVDKSVWKLFGELGWFGLLYSKDVGGSEKDFFYSVILLEELGLIGYTGFQIAVAVHAYMAIAYIAYAGSTDLKKFYLTPAIKGDRISALAITEPEAGSDISGIKTTATLKNNYYKIDGCKKFVANGTIADFVIVAVKTERRPSQGKEKTAGISLIVVDTNTPGLYRKSMDTLGWHSSDIAELNFNSVLVPQSNLIGNANSGLMYIMYCLQLERLVAGILSLGSIENCIKVTWQYLLKRKVSNIFLSQFQVLRHDMAAMITELEILRHMAYHTAWLYSGFYQSRELPIAECSMLKLKSTELAKRSAYKCMQFHGAYGYQNDSDISRICRDSLATTIAGGASQVMLDIIAQMTLDEGWKW